MDPWATSGQVARAAQLRQVVDELGDWVAGTGPLPRRLARAVAAAIERGSLPPDARLPSERALSRALSVARGTVVAAYDQLVATGTVERRPGSGTFVHAPRDLALPAGREGSGLVARLVDRSAPPPPTASTRAGDTGIIDLSISVLRDATGLPPVSVDAKALAEVTPDTGYSPWGLPALRDALAQLVTSWGLPTTPAQIVVTTGAQQAITTAAAAWIRPGDRVVVEDPTYPGATAAFTAAGATVVGVPVDGGGIQLAPLRAALARPPALVYLQPPLHSPTGVVLAASRRHEIADLVTRARVPLVEDHALADLAWDVARPIPPIAALAPTAPIAVLGSLSKRYWGGLRLGFVRAPEPVAVRFARVKATGDLGSSAVSQLLATAALAHPHEAAIRHRRDQALRARWSVLAAELGRLLPSWRWHPPLGGLSVWVQLPGPVAGELAQAGLRHGVAVATADGLAPTAHPDRLRLSFAGPEAELAEGVRRLAAAWRSLPATQRGDGA